MAPVLKVRVVSFSDSGGGAFRCAYRLHRSLLDAGTDSRMRVVQKLTGDPTVIEPATAAQRWIGRARNSLVVRLARAVGPHDHVYRSLACLPTGLHRELDACAADIVHLHWVGGEMISVDEIARLRTPVVWTLHDEWAYRGAEHIDTGSAVDRWRAGYTRGNRPSSGCLLDVDGWTWRRKRRAWVTPMTAICPSHWLAERARSSLLLRDWRIEVIRNPINTETWRPKVRADCRRRLGLPPDKPLVVFGAVGGTSDPNKGADLLRTALHHLERAHPAATEVAVFGQDAPAVSESWPMPVRYLGAIADDERLMTVYSAADVVVVPSRIENLPNIAVEAQCCGTPVVAFATGGLPECVVHGSTGYLAKPFDAQDLAAGMNWVVRDPERHRSLCAQARDFAVREFAAGPLAGRLLDLYREVLSAGA